MKINSETYAIVADSPFSTVTSQVNGRQITVHVANMNIYPNTYYLGNYSGNMIDTICTYNAEDMSCKLEFNVYLKNSHMICHFLQIKRPCM